MKYFIFTYGCQMNVSDSERLAAYFQSKSWEPALNENQADLVVFNMCSVRQSAVDRVYYKIKNLKLKNKNYKVILTGCVLTADKKKFEDLRVEIRKIKQLPLNCRHKARLVPKQTKIKGETKPASTIIQPNNETAYVPIMRGCNNFCSYCVVPYTRGREWSRSAEKILSEVLTFVKQGYKEVMLLGQNVNSYKAPYLYHSEGDGAIAKPTEESQDIPINRNNISGSFTPRQYLRVQDDKKAMDFADLLKIINSLPGDFKIRFLTSHPKDMSDKLIQTITDCNKVIHEIHLPVQSGDNEILRQMNRGYTREYYLELVKKIKLKIPDVKLTTDIIVGFPGETRQQFRQTVDLVKKAGYAKAYIACYSPRPGTAAAKLKDDIPPAEKKLREQVLRKIIG